MIHVAARKYIGVPFGHQGRDPSVSLDCIGLCQVAARDCGHVVPDWLDYSRNPHGGLLEQRMASVLVRESVWRPGLIAAIRWGGPVRHVGILGDHADGLSLIHTDSMLGRVTEHRIDAKWARRIVSVWRLA